MNRSIKIIALSAGIVSNVFAGDPSRLAVIGKSDQHEIIINFESNKGQWPVQVQFKSDIGEGRRVFFENDRFTYTMYDHRELYNIHERELKEKRPLPDSKINSHAFQMVFLNAGKNSAINGKDRLQKYSNYYLGNDPAKWASEVPAYSKISYTNLYEGIDVNAYSSSRQLKYDYIIRKGADVNQIQLKFEGATTVFVKNNTLYIVTSIGEVVETMPNCYQVIEGREKKVKCEYKISSDGIVTFDLPEGYNKNYDLVIDPVVMASTYTGSTANTFGHCAAYDLNGNIYTGGRTFAQGYPTTLGAFQTTFGGSVDISISKMNPTGSTMIYSTYLGGSDEDYSHSMFVQNNELYVYGSTTSTNYPTSSGCYDSSPNGLSDIVVSKFNSGGTALLGSTYVGGSGEDGINNSAGYNYGDTYRGEIVVNTGGDAFIAGTTESTNFPVTTGAYDVTHNGFQDAVILKMNSSLTALTWATFIGGNDHETAYSLRVVPSGDVYAVGLTGSANFPTTSGAAMQTYMGGVMDGYVARFNSTGSTLINCTYIGTTLQDIIYFTDVDFNSEIYIYGISTGNFTVSPGVYSNSGSQTFHMKLNTTLSSVLYSTVLGSGFHSSFSPSAFMVDLCQNVYMSGWGSTNGYPITSNAAQSITDNSDFHLMVLSPGATSLVYGTFYGAPNSFEHVDGGTSRFDPNGLVYQGVCQCGNNFPVLPNSVSMTNNSPSCDVAVFKIDFQLNCNPLLNNIKICYGSVAPLTIMNLNNLSNPSYSIQPGGQIQSTPVFTVSPTVNTSYTLFITGTNYLNATMTSSGVTNVTVTPQPVLNPTITQPSCVNSNNSINLGLSFLPITSPTSYSIAWSTIPAGITSNTQTSVNGGIAAGPYSATLTSINGCKAYANFTMNPSPIAVTFSVLGSLMVNCTQPTIELIASPATNDYTWTSNSSVFTGSAVTLGVNNTGSFVVYALSTISGCGTSQTFILNSDFAQPTSTVTPMSQNITCSVTSVITVTATGNPSVNISHYWISPYGGTLIANMVPAIYPPTAPGTYTHIMVNNVNGCSVSKTFTVSSTSGFPTFSVSSPQNFTLGCYTRSVATINITNAQTTPTPGGSVSYTLLPPTFGGGAYNTSSLSTFSNVIVPGTYTVITKDNTNLCETRIQLSVIQNTFSPNIGVIVPRQILTCDHPNALLQGISTSTGVAYNWSFPGIPGNLPTDTIRIIKGINPTNTLIANYTLTITDMNNTCISTTVVPMLQNIFVPKALFSGDKPLTCYTQTITLTNVSSTSIPPAFNPVLPVVGYLWQGPSPQDPLSLSTTYVGYMPGTYTLTVKDLNNGCFAVTTRTVDDARDYPVVNNPKAPAPFIFDCAANGATIYPTISSSTVSLTYSWTAVASSSISSITQPTTIVNNIGLYKVLVTNTLNGCTSQGFVEVIYGKLNANFKADPDNGFAPLNVTFINQSSSSSTVTGLQGITCSWNFGNGNIVSAKAATFYPTTKYTQAGTYTVVLFAQKGSCSDTAVRIVTVEMPSMLEIPNVFTPNNDGTNDLFFVKATNLTELSATINDRWGHLVYEVSSKSGNISWDGFNQTGKQVAAGVYFYVITARGSDGANYVRNGTLTLIR